jgi:hypothetical protein
MTSSKTRDVEIKMMEEVTAAITSNQTTKGEEREAVDNG